MSSAGGELKEIKRDLRRAVDIWLPKRRRTIKILEQAAERIQYRGKIANRVKLGGNAVGALSGFASGTLGILTIVSTGGLGTPFVVAGTVAAGTGILSAVAAGGAEVTKSIMLSNLFQEAQTSFNEEIDAYLTVLMNVNRLYMQVTDKSVIDSPGDQCAYLTAARYFSDAGVSIMAACSNILHSHFTKLASRAAAKAAIETARETAGVTTDALALAKIATSAADEATNTTVGLLLKHMYQNSTEHVIATAGDKASELVLAVGKGISDEATVIAAVETATVRAAKSAGKSIAKESVSLTGDVLEAGGWRLISTGLQVANKLLPLVNFGFAIWDVAESVTARYDIAWGTKEEKILREKIKQLKYEANSIIDEIFNPLFNKKIIDTPFPDDQP